MSSLPKVAKLPRSARPAVSVIIPTLNESYRLPGLLDSLAAQTYRSFEVIVADASSIDGTRAIARRYGATVVRGGLPSVGRNAGARAARAPLFLFLDADVTLEASFLATMLHEFQSRSLGVAALYLRSETRSAPYILGSLIWNVWISVLQPLRAQAAGWGTVVSRTVFDRVGGYDESLHFSEDINFGWRASKVSKYGVLPVALTVSDRRFRQPGKWRTMALYLRFGIRYLLWPSRAFVPVAYEFGNHPEQQNRSVFPRFLASSRRGKQ